MLVPKTLARKPLTVAVNVAVDHAVRVQAPVVAGYVSGLRRRHPDADPAQVVDLLTRRYLTAVTGTGAAVGGAAALPAVGTLAALGLGAGELAAFIEASALYALAVAHVHGVRIEDVERRKALLLAVLAGESGAALMEKATGRGEVAWGLLLPDRVPRVAVEQVNRQLGKWAMRRFTARQGVAAFGRLIPFGVGAVIGGAANAGIGRAVVGSVRRAFGTPPAQFAAELEPSPAPKTLLGRGSRARTAPAAIEASPAPAPEG